ncbi:prolyl oligopeptidase family serine peptidase [Cyclobacterium sp.]|uniref:carboxylesterase family protein n=1 Tax=Cyclobacterium sp. TaxID=1966343 RepID=UPI0019923F78|nr:prolyl oligopeptidase family serine peptidase [Cyclobacterium sp.]MBD3629244.1 prolyl oligopeptidase family serine peptidase [Cyclobacterium sp.]
MHKQVAAFFPALILLSGLFFSTWAQSTSDQIIFKTGWVTTYGVPVKYPRYARSEFPADPVVARLLAGESIPAADKQHPEGSWEPITADENGRFKHEYLAAGGLYLEYESPSDQILIFDASGHGKAYINGAPREGDHFGFGITKHPVMIKKGLNTFYLTGGRNPEIKASLYTPESDLMLSADQLTLPDLVIEEKGFKWAGIKLTNATGKPARGYQIESIVNGSEKMISQVPDLEKLTSKLLPFRISELQGQTQKEVDLQVNLLAQSGKVISSLSLTLNNQSFNSQHDRTFISSMDGSVQYYSVSPGKVQEGKAPALFFSTHGAGVEARGQAAVYAPKDWGHLIAPTNRGPFGFAWEDWGRLDALEVLEIGKALFQPDPQKIYLTGHSMGGHASWYLGATYPDHWAAIGPCAGYAELHDWIEHSRKVSTEMERMFQRASNPQRILLLQRNYLHFGVYIHHGDADQVVPVTHARQMKKLLADFHPDFAYHEYPGGGHWFGNISADWPPLFDFLKNHERPKAAEIRQLEFSTASPGVSSSSNWLTIYQQIRPFQPSHVKLQIAEEASSLSGTTENVKVLQLDLKMAAVSFPFSLQIDETQLIVEQPVNDIVLVRNEDRNWAIGSLPGKNEKGPHRNGNFKDAFRNQVVFVYGTRGNKEEDGWNFHKARYDAETFGYRGNGSIEMISDQQFSPEKYQDRNVILYGNADTNSAWDALLGDSPVQVMNGQMTAGERIWRGDGWACLFIRPRPDSAIASVGVVAGTGLRGFKAALGNQYFLAGTAFPDLTVIGAEVFEKEYEAVAGAGFFGNDWSLELGEFVWD